jgi:alkylhydroperoxidase/carboxymuconolactone decarboxylase family protein YurZ
MSQPETNRNVSAEDVQAAWDYALEYYGAGVTDVLGPLAEYRPEVFHGYITLRRAAFNTGPDAALSPKMKELIILAIEIATRKTNPPPVGHTRRAMAAGATVQEIAEVASLCLMIGGMLTYHEAGWPVLKLAQEIAAGQGSSPTSDDVS